MRLAFFNVNEEGTPYGVHDTLDEAVQALAEFPNDGVVVVIEGSPWHRTLMAGLESA